MTREEAIARIREHMIIHENKELRAIYITEALDMAIQALSQEPCTDAVSREKVINTIDKWLIEHKPRHYLVQSIRELPSVTQKSGKWRPVYQGDEIINYRCSECEFGNTFGKSTYRMNYCPNCGAKMESEEQTE